MPRVAISRDTNVPYTSSSCHSGGSNERLKVADSASSTKAPEAGIREDCDELANDRKGRSTACYFAFVIGKS
jgi:hypothetical protein